MVQHHDLALLEIQSQLLVEKLQCWFALADQGSDMVYGVMTTGIVRDEFSGTNNLLIYTVTVTDAHPSSLWEEAYIPLRIYAKSLLCTEIVAYSNQPRMLEIAERLGADTSWRLIQLPI